MRVSTVSVRRPTAARRRPYVELGVASDLPEQFRSPVTPLIANAYSTIGTGVLAFGLVDLNLLATVTGILITNGGKAWYMDRMTLLFAEMKSRSDEYAAWDF